MAQLTIVTNNVPRFLIYAYELTEKERLEFDYMDWEEIDQGEDSASFFRYKGQLYDLGEFQRIVRPGSRITFGADFFDPGNQFSGWHGIQSDSYFSGLLVKCVGEDMDSVVVGRYYS